MKVRKGKGRRMEVGAVLALEPAGSRRGKGSSNELLEKGKKTEMERKKRKAKKKGRPENPKGKRAAIKRIAELS